MRYFLKIMYSDSDAFENISEKGRLEKNLARRKLKVIKNFPRVYLPPDYY